MKTLFIHYISFLNAQAGITQSVYWKDMH